MKLARFLIITTAVTVVGMHSVMAQNAPEVQAPSQPFVHPANDESYSKDLRDDATLPDAQAKSEADAPPAPEQSPVQMSNAAVEFVSGGVGDSGMQAIDAEQHHYNLKLLFANKAGEYLADVRVVITDKDGAAVIDTRTKGPVLLARLPAGKYKIDSTTAGGESLSRSVTLSGKMHSDVLHFGGGENQ